MTTSPQPPKSLQELSRLSQCIAESPNNPELRTQLGFAFLSIGEHQQALHSFLNSQKIDSTYANAYFGESVTRFELGQHRLALEKLNLAINRAPSDQRLWSARAHMLAATGESAETVFQAYEQWGKRFPNKYVVLTHQKKQRECGQRIRLGYISADFRNHALGYFFLPVLANHNREKFELFGFFNGEADSQTKQFCEQFDHWQPVRHLSDRDLSQLIHELDLDILIDLSGHTAGNRLIALASHPARHQITWYGYNCTTGMKAMDYRLTDAIMDPQGNETYSSEKLLRLPSFCCYGPPVNLPPPPPPPVLTNGYITFGCLNNPQKITPATLTLWAEILKKLPDARLRLIAPYGPTGESSTKQTYLDLLNSHSIPVERVELVAKLSMNDFFEQNRFIDIALEPTPFTGGVTTAHCLWMGIPTITLAGTLPLSRAAAGILGALGLSQLITNSKEDYLLKCLSFAEETETLRTLRLNLRQHMNNSKLMDHKNHVQALELLMTEIVFPKY